MATQTTARTNGAALTHDAEIARDMLASMTDAELDALVRERRAASATFAVTYMPPGTDTRGDGMFTTVNPKLEVTVTLGRGKPRVVREDLPVWAAILAHVEDIRDAIEGATGEAGE